jgi:hypothetical protein
MDASPVYFRRIGAQKPSGALVSGMWASETLASGRFNDLAVAGGGYGNSFHGSTVYAIGSHTISLRFRMSSIANGSVLLATPNDVYIVGGSSVSEVAIRTGRVVHTYAAPQIPFTPPPGYRGQIVGQTSGGTIQSLVLDKGRLYAFQLDAYAVAVDDLSNGTDHLLGGGYGELGGGVLAANGDLYVMAWSSEHLSSFTLLRIDPSNLSVISKLHTGVRATSVRHVDMQALPGGGLLAFVTQQRQSESNIPVDAYLWKLANSGLERRDMPANIGLDMRAFANGVYIFGGPGRNIVARLSLSNLALTRDVPELSTPVGTWIFALN